MSQRLEKSGVDVEVRSRERVEKVEAQVRRWGHPSTGRVWGVIKILAG